MVKRRKAAEGLRGERRKKKVFQKSEDFSKAEGRKGNTYQQTTKNGHYFFDLQLFSVASGAGGDRVLF